MMLPKSCITVESEPALLCTIDVLSYWERTKSGSDLLLKVVAKTGGVAFAFVHRARKYSIVKPSGFLTLVTKQHQIIYGHAVTALYRAQ